MFVNKERSELSLINRRYFLTLIGVSAASGLLSACAPSAASSKIEDKPSLPAAAAKNEATAAAVVRIDLGGNPAFTFYGSEVVQHPLYFSMKNAYRIDQGRRIGPIQFVNFASNREDYVGLDLDGPRSAFRFTPLDESIRAVDPRDKGQMEKLGEKIRPTVFEGRLSVVRHEAASVLT